MASDSAMIGTIARLWAFCSLQDVLGTLGYVDAYESFWVLPHASAFDVATSCTPSIGSGQVTTNSFLEIKEVVLFRLDLHLEVEQTRPKGVMPSTTLGFPSL